MPCLTNTDTALDEGGAFLTLQDIMTGNTQQLIDIGVLVLRCFIGPCFVVHGLGKLGIVGPGSMEGFTGWLKSLGFPAPAFQARMAMLTEIIGGALLTFGLLTRPVCLLLFGTMMVAALFGHKGGGYLVTNDPPGNEYPLNLAAICIVFIIIGPGAYSLDAVIFG